MELLENQNRFRMIPIAIYDSVERIKQTLNSPITASLKGVQCQLRRAPKSCYIHKLC